MNGSRGWFFGWGGAIGLLERLTVAAERIAATVDGGPRRVPSWWASKLLRTMEGVPAASRGGEFWRAVADEVERVLAAAKRGPHIEATRRCQAHGAEGKGDIQQCVLPMGHLCGHLCEGEPLSLGQAMAFAAEASLREGGRAT